MNPIAEDLNRTLADTALPRLLSDFGRRLYFPRGVVAQTAEATRHAHRFNATVGIATDGATPMYLDGIRALIPQLAPEAIFAYAPTAGLPDLRRAWLREMQEKNPSLQGPVSMPLVTSGLTHGITIAADLLVERGDRVVVPDLYWGNYRLVMEERRQARLETVPFFTPDGGLDVAALAAAAPPDPGRRQGGPAPQLPQQPDRLHSERRRDGGPRGRLAGKAPSAACCWW